MDNLQMFSFLKKLVIDEQKKLLAILHFQFHATVPRLRFIGKIFFLSVLLFLLHFNLKYVKKKHR